MFVRSRYSFSMLRCGVPRSRFLRHSIVCTIGPSSQKVETLKKLIAEGMTVARMNFSHGTYDYHHQTVRNVRQASEETGVPIAIALDTKGPEVRTGLFKDKQAVIMAGEECVLTTDSAAYPIGTKEKFYVDYRNLPRVVRPGSMVFVDDGNLVLEVLEKNSTQDSIRCRALNTHTLSGHRGVNLPDSIVDLPAVSEKDRDDIQFGVEQGVDYIFASFIRTAEHVDEVRSLIPHQAKTTLSSSSMLIFSKIENQQALDNIHSIVDRSDGILIARGDLGVEIALERVVVEQKRLTRVAKHFPGKPVICATQMMESMITRPRPTRAEVADVTNAVLDGVDAVMLSGESANGQYPVEAVRYMANICRAADEYSQGFSSTISSPRATGREAGGRSCISNNDSTSCVGGHHDSFNRPQMALCKAAEGVAKKIGAKAIVCHDPSVAAELSTGNLFCPVVLVTHEERVARQLAIWRGVVVVVVPPQHGTQARTTETELLRVESFLQAKGYGVRGDPLIWMHMKAERENKEAAKGFSVRNMQ